MNGNARPTLPEWLTIAGALAVVVGTWLPWIVHSPGTDVVIQVYVPGMETGIAAPDYVVLAVLAVGLVVAAYYRRERRGGVAVTGTGVLVAVLTVGYLVATLTGGGVTFGAFVPGPGAIVTVGGSLVLIVAGWRRITTAPPERNAADGPKTSA